jgi:hypothetical protein
MLSVRNAVDRGAPGRLAGQLPLDLIAGTVTRARLHQVLDAIQRIYGARA